MYNITSQGKVSNYTLYQNKLSYLEMAPTIKNKQGRRMCSFQYTRSHFQDSISLDKTQSRCQILLVEI